MNCKEAKNFMSPYMDGELEGNFALEFISHLEECEKCRQGYQEMVQISRLFQSEGKTIIPAPDGFKDSVMRRIAAKQDSSRSAVLGRLKRSWKQMAASAAAVVLLVFTSYTYALPPLIQMAEREQDPVVSTDNSASVEKIDQTDNVAVDVQPSTEHSVSNNTQPNNSDNPQPGSEAPDNEPVINNADPQTTENAPVLLSEDQQNIKTTLLKIAAREEIPSSYDKAVSTAQKLGAQTENLGQQSKDDITYQQVKIVVTRDNEDALIASLHNLGDVISEQPDYKDISTAYQKTVDQYNDLNEQKSGIEDAEELKRLESEIDALADKLGAFQQQAEKVTIVLWLQQ